MISVTNERPPIDRDEADHLRTHTGNWAVFRTSSPINNKTTLIACCISLKGLKWNGNNASRTMGKKQNAKSSNWPWDDQTESKRNSTLHLGVSITQFVLTDQYTFYKWHLIIFPMEPVEALLNTYNSTRTLQVKRIERKVARIGY